MNSRADKAAGLPGRILPAALLLFALCLLALGVLPAYSAFTDLGAGARGPGMGNAMTPVADDVSAVHYNPAGLGLLARPQFTAAYAQLFSGLADNSRLGTSFFGYAHPVAEGKLGTVAGAFNSFTLDGGLYLENTLYLSYGRKAYTTPGGNQLFLGATLKYLYSSFGSFTESANATNGIIRTGQADPLLSGNSSHKAIDADLGALYTITPHYQLGLQLAHVTQPDMAFGPKEPDPLPLAVKLGFNYRSLISNLALQVEAKKAPGGATDKIFTVAGERWFPKAFTGDFGVRGAMGAGSREYKQLSLGLSYRNRRLQVDYAFALPLNTIASTSGMHRMAITFRFGKATEQEETLETVMQILRTRKLPEDISKSNAPLAGEAGGAGNEIAVRLARAEEAGKGGRYREAVSLSASVIELDPGNASAWQTMGTAYLGMEKYASSLHAWTKAYEYEKSAALKQAIKGYIKAITQLERAQQLKQQPVDARRSTLPQEEIDTLLNRGVDHYINREFDKARQIFERILKSEPDNVEALKALRRVKEETPR